VYLDGGELGEILLPNRYVPRGTIAGEVVDVFVFCDSADRLVATTETPHASVGEFAYLRVVSFKPGVGAFLDWGLSKDLLLPIREQDHRVAVGEWVVASILVDEKTMRIVGSTRLNRHLNRTPPTYKEGQAVSLLIAGETDLGYNAIIENAHRGLLYRSDLSGPLAIGQRHDGFVRVVRPDGKIDLSLDAAGYQRVAPLADRILELLRENGGRLPFNDESSPAEIREMFGSSKKAFKQAIGALYRERRVQIEAHGIRLLVTK
jgi:predicted RNA-binding protein (virulence factor B family)